MLPGIGIIELYSNPSKINPGPPSAMNQCRTECALVGGAAAATNFLRSNFISAIPGLVIFALARSIRIQMLRRLLTHPGSHSMPALTETVQPAHAAAKHISATAPCVCSAKPVAL